jgi:hypothetical protein
MSLNTLEKDNILQVVSRQEERIRRLEAMLNGQGIRTARIADAAITDAKIDSLSADKITTGDLVVAVDVGDPASGYLRIDGVNNRIVGNDGTTNRFVLGDV